MLLLPSLATTQELRPQFGSRVEVARIQVSIVDGEGRFVSGLGPDDFEVRVAGETRQLVDLLEVTVADAPAGENTAAASEAAPPGDVLAVAAMPAVEERTSERRHFVLFLDLSSMNFRALRYAKRIMAEFVDRIIEPEDRVGLVVYSPSAGLQWLVPATSRHRLVADAIGRLRPSRSGEAIDTELDDLPSEIAAEGFAFDQLANDFVALEAEDLIAAVAQVGQDMASLEARKHLIMLSRGYGDGLYQDPGFVQAMDRALEQIRRTDVVVHTIFPDRLDGTLGQRSFLYQVADETGGTSTWFQHNADRGMEELDRATRSYYVLSIPVRSDDPDRLPLDVRTLRAGVSVRWAPVEIRSPEGIRRLSDMQRQIQVAAALDPGFDPDLMNFSLRVLPLGMVDGRGRFAVLMQMETDELERLATERGDGSLRFELLGVAMRPGGQLGDFFRSSLGAEDRARDAVAVGALRYLGVFSAPPGRGLFKLLLREASLGKLSARSAGFFVPDELSGGLWAGEPLRVLGQAMADVARSEEIDDDNYPLTVVGRRLVPDLTPLARAGSANQVLVVLSNLASHPFTGRYQLLARAEIASAGEEPFELEWVRVRGIEPAVEPNMFRALIEFELPRALPSGEATLTFVLADAVSGEQTTTVLSLGILGE